MGKIFIYTIFSFILFSSCSKEEGIGGKNTIEGRVIIQDILTNPIQGITDSLTAEYPAIDEKVYIIYGEDNGFVNNDASTSYDGQFKFEWLKQGTYTVYVVQKCEEDDCGDKEETRISYTIEITSRKSSSRTPDLYIINRINN